MLEQIARPFIPVNSFIQEPAIPTETPPRPEVGIRWGKPSKFEHSNQGKRPGRRLIVNQPEDDEEEELREEYEIVKLRGSAYRYNAKDRKGAFIQMTSTIRFSGRKIVQRYDDQGRRKMPGNLEIEYYFDLTLNEPE